MISWTIRAIPVLVMAYFLNDFITLILPQLGRIALSLGAH